MALTQRQLAECAREALAAQQAYDELLEALREVLARKELEASAKVALLGHVSTHQPVVACTRSEAALEHIRKTGKRNEQRAAEARARRAEGRR